MLRRAVVIAAVVGLVFIGGASAYVHPTFPGSEPLASLPDAGAGDAALAGLLENPTAATSVYAGVADEVVQGELLAEATSAGALPALTATTVAASSVVALGVGWYVGGAIDRTFHLSGAIADTMWGWADSGHASYTTFVGWDYMQNVTGFLPCSSGFLGTTLIAYGGASLCNVYLPHFTNSDTSGAGCHGGCQYVYCTDCSGGFEPGADAGAAMATYMTRLVMADPDLTIVRIQGGWEAGGCSTSTHCYTVVLSPEQLERHLSVPSSVSGSVSATVSVPSWTPSITPPVPASVPSPARAAIDKAIDPGYDIGLVFQLPEPDIGESYSDYLARLTDLGYVGTATEVDVSEEAGDSSRGPSAAIAVKDTTSGSTWWTAGSWPGAGDPEFPAGDDISIRVNPEDYPVVAGGGSGSCTCPPIDTSPLTSVDVGTRFPFGVFTWFTDAIGDVPAAHAMTWTISKPGGGSITIDTTNSEWEDVIRPVVFPVVEFLMTLAMFYLFGTRILGLGGGSESDD